MPPSPVPPARGTGRSRGLLAVALVAVVVALVAVTVAALGRGADDSPRADATDDADGGVGDDDEGEDDEGERFVVVGEAIDPAPTAPDAPDPAPAAPATGEAVDLSVVQLESALLTEMDQLHLGEAFPGSTNTSDGLTSADMIVVPECRALLEEHEGRGTRPRFGGVPADAPRQARREFGRQGRTVEHEVADGVDVTIDEYRELFTVCETIEWDDPGRGIGRLRFTVLDQAGPDLGDDVLHIEYSFNGGESVVRWAIWTRDSVLSSLNISALGHGGVPDAAGAEYDLADAAHIADTRLAQVIANR